MEKMITVTMYLQIDNLPLDWLTKQANLYMLFQRQFKGEVLTGKEESDLLHRLCKMTNHPCLNQLHKLLSTQWIIAYQQVHTS